MRQGRAHRPCARDRAVPSERDGAIGHGSYATATLHTAPVRRRPAAARSRGPDRRARPKATRRCARVGDRHAVEHELALVNENRPAGHLHARGCRALRRVICLHAQPRRECRRRSARRTRQTCAPMRRMRQPRARASTCACCDGCSTCYQSARIASWPSRLLYKLSPPQYSCSNCCLLGTRSSTRASSSITTANQHSNYSKCVRVCARARRVGRTARVRVIVLLPRNVTAPSNM
jgi:hypothetical protein